MGPRSPPTLLQLGVQSLLEAEEVALAALEDLPGDLFLPVFEEAFVRGLTEVLKALVLSWPFPRLPLGSLVKVEHTTLSVSLLGAIHVQRSNWQALQAVLDALDELLTREDLPRRLRLRVVDTRAMHLDVRKIWAGNLEEACFPTAPKRRRTEQSGPPAAEKQLLTVILDIWVRDGQLGSFSTELLRWVQERKELVWLDCKKLSIVGKDIPSAAEPLASLDLSRVREADVTFGRAVSTLFIFTHFLSHMPNLRKLRICDTFENPLVIAEEREPPVGLSVPRYLQLPYLRKIYLDSVFFLEGNLAQVLRSLTSPLETLSLVRCGLSQADWDQLPQCPSTRHLRHLGLCGIRLTDFSPGPLQSLLTNTAATLTSLHLEALGMTEAQLCAILPALSRCTQLSVLRCVQNSLSVATLEKLLAHTAKLDSLRLELYEVPEEVFGSPSATPRLQLDRVCTVLRWIVKPLRHPRTVWFTGPHCHLRADWELHSWHRAPCPACIPI